MIGRVKRTASIAALATVSILAGCGGSADEADTANCVEVTDERQQAIADGASGAPITPQAAAAYLAPGNEALHIVAMRFTMPGDDEPMVGVWSTNNPGDGAAVITAIDGFAGQFTNWPTTELNAASPGVDEAKACLGT